MNAVEFEAELSTSPTLVIPAELAARLPKSGRARVLLLTEGDDALADLDAAYAAGYARLPEDASLSAGVLRHVALDVGQWE